MQHCHYDNDSKQLTEAFLCFIICAVIITTPCLTIAICAGIITTQYLPITAFEEKGDQTRTRIDSRLLTSLGPYRQAKPADTQSILERVLCPSNRLYIVSALVFRSPLSIKHNPITFYICFLLVFIYFLFYFMVHCHHTCHRVCLYTHLLAHSVPVQMQKQIFLVHDGNLKVLLAGRSLFRLPSSGTTFLLTPNNAALSHSSKLLLKHLSLLLPTLIYSNPFIGIECCD